jgi:hypothetical protein
MYVLVKIRRVSVVKFPSLIYTSAKVYIHEAVKEFMVDSMVS